MSDGAEFRIICLECSCGRRWWLRTVEVGFQQPKALEGRLVCRACGSRQNKAMYADHAAIPPALDAEAWYTVDVWSDNGDKLVEVMATTRNLRIGHAAYEAAMIERPNRILTFRDRARLIRHNERKR